MLNLKAFHYFNKISILQLRLLSRPQAYRDTCVQKSLMKSPTWWLIGATKAQNDRARIHSEIKGPPVMKISIKQEKWRLDEMSEDKKTYRRHDAAPMRFHFARFSSKDFEMMLKIVSFQDLDRATKVGSTTTGLSDNLSK